MATVSHLPGYVLSQFACWNCSVLESPNKNTILLSGGRGDWAPTYHLTFKENLKKKKSLIGKNVVEQHSKGIYIKK